MSSLIKIIIRIYQRLVSPFLGKNCRFYPSCSEYSYQAFSRFSWHKALYISFRRIIRCHPFNEGGVDYLNW